MDNWSELLRIAQAEERKALPPTPAPFNKLFQIEMLLLNANISYELSDQIYNEFLDYDETKADEILTLLYQNQLPQTPQYGFCHKITELGVAVKTSVQNLKT